MKTYRLKEVALLLAMLLIPGVVSAKEIVQGEVWLDTAGNPSGCVAIGDCPDPFRGRGGGFPSERRTLRGESRRASLSPHPEGILGTAHTAMQGAWNEYDMSIYILECP
jgi:hypothetical protein